MLSWKNIRMHFLKSLDMRENSRIHLNYVQHYCMAINLFVLDIWTLLVTKLTALGYFTFGTMEMHLTLYVYAEKCGYKLA